VPRTALTSRPIDVETPIRLHRIVWDTRRDRPAGDHLQRLAGCGDVADRFPVESWIEVATPDMELFVVSDEQLAALADRQPPACA
jgi:hypothetical protein